MVESLVFAACAVIVLSGGLGVILSRNPVHAALSLVATLFGVAVLFVAMEANFLAAVQIIVYAGAIVVLFLFVIMLLGVDQADDLDTEPLVAQRALAVVAGVLLGGILVAVVATSTITGAPEAGATWDRTSADVAQIGRLLFTDYLFAFEITSLLLVIAVVGAVLLARTRAGEQIDEDETVPAVGPTVREADADDDRADADRADTDRADADRADDDTDVGVSR